MKLFVGLGNPGSAYARHRHNVGFMAVDRIAERHRLGPWKKRFKGYACDGTMSGHRVMLLKPQTFMNESGQAVGEARRYLKLDVGDIYVFHDEIDLAPGKLKVKTGGGNAGHNGLRSISAHIGNDYARVRIGVGHPGVKDLVHGHVLHDFAKADIQWLDPLLDAIADAAGRLAAGNAARFLTDVARVLKDDGGKQERGKTKSTADETAPGRTPSEPPSASRATRAGALAESLKRWLKGHGRES